MQAYKIEIGPMSETYKGANPWVRVGEIVESDPSLGRYQPCVTAVEPCSEPPAAAVVTDAPRVLVTPAPAPAPSERPVPILSLVQAPEPPRVVRGSTVDAAGRARSEADLAAALEAGFAPEKPLYATGTLVVDRGVENARTSRRAWEAMPLAREALLELVDTIRAEKRRDVQLSTADIRMQGDGTIRLPSGETLAMESRAFGDFTRAMGLASGAGTYLAACEPGLRAHNVNQWLTGHGSPEWASKATRLRIREGDAGPTIYAAVSDGYAAFDVDKIALQLARTLPEGGRGEVFYDGRKFHADVMWHSDIQAENYVAGEFFKAGLRFRSDDTGGGSCNGSALLYRNLCLNLIIIDEARRELFRLRHFGRGVQFARALHTGVIAGERATAHFRRAWGQALSETMNPETIACQGEGKPETLTDLMWGVFLHEAKQSDVLKRGEVPALIRAWRHEPDATRAGVVNAITRHAHDVDPFRADDLERYAGKLLRSTKPFAWQAPETRDRNALHAR